MAARELFLRKKTPKAITFGVLRNCDDSLTGCRRWRLQAPQRVQEPV
jgi:hypothetical protein